MGYWLATAADQQVKGFIKRFDPRFWTVNFPRPMMASVVTIAPDALRVDAVFYRNGDLAGLIWDAEIIMIIRCWDMRRCGIFGAAGCGSGGVRAG